jgi:iron complex outermembrane receptor protein
MILLRLRARGAARLTICVLLMASLTLPGWADDTEPERPADLTNMSLEDLMNIEVTSVSKKEQKLSRAASAIYVISSEDLRRSGATSIPEALRMAPGLSVARIDANVWAISARGFNERFANKMLVLIDGRSVYTPLFSGVYWDVQDVLLEDVDRIEVIRGPGATLWGANAVNGVINIITKPARDTQGGLVAAGAGSEERGFGGLRYGGKLGRHAHYRFYTKYFNRNNFVDASGRDAADGWDVLRGGFRMDWKAAGDGLTLQGDIYNGGAGQTVTLTSLFPPFARRVNDRIKLSGGNVLARWHHAFSGGSDMAVQLYYDRTARNDVGLMEIRDISDIDFQHHFPLGTRQDIVWGLGHRYMGDFLEGGFTVSFQPKRRGNHLFSAFVQDEILLVNDRLRLTLGSKFERNDYTGFEGQPSARLLWTPHHRHTLWAAVSRAVRMPSRDNDLRINLAAFPGAGGALNLLSLFGNWQFKSEDLRAYELGYRVQPRKRLSLDVATFYNVYRHLRTFEPGLPFFESDPLPHRVFPLRYDNQMHGNTYGVESAASWNVTSGWKLSTGYTFFQARWHREASSQDTTAEKKAGNSPKHQWHVASYLRLPGNWEFDSALYYVDHLVNQGVPSYVRLDARFGWHPREAFDVSMGLQNLLDDRHPEFGASDITATQVKRSLYGKITWRF